MEERAIIAGASGLVGGRLLETLLADEAWGSVTALGRRPCGREHPKLREVICDLDGMEARSSALSGDCVFCCLGTTMKKAGSKEAFRKVDLEFPVRLGEVAKRNGTRRMVVVSAVGADAGSRFFYNRVKGEMEERLSQLGIHSLDIVRPSLLLGKREAFRLGEAVAQLTAPVWGWLLRGRWERYRPIEAEQVARAMAAIGKRGGSGGVRTHERRELARH